MPTSDSPNLQAKPVFGLDIWEEVVCHLGFQDTGTLFNLLTVSKVLHDAVAGRAILDTVSITATSQLPQLAFHLARNPGYATYVKVLRFDIDDDGAVMEALGAAGIAHDLAAIPILLYSMVDLRTLSDVPAPAASFDALCRAICKLRYLSKLRVFDYDGTNLAEDDGLIKYWTPEHIHDLLNRMESARESSLGLQNLDFEMASCGLHRPDT